MASKENHYLKLKAYLPKGYRIRISENTGASISLINKVLRGTIDDTKGILVEAYRIANEFVDKKASDAKELAFLKNKIARKL